MDAMFALPTAIDSERMILGAVLLNGALFESVVESVDESDFSMEKHRLVFASMKALFDRGEKIDHVMAYHELVRRGDDGAVGKLTGLMELETGMPLLPNVDAYIRIVKEKALLRGAIFACQQTINRCLSADDGAEGVLMEAEATIAKLAAGGATGRAAWMRPGEIMSSHPGGVQAFLTPRNGGNGIRTPWDPLTDKLCGFHQEDLVVLAGRPSMGKSVCAMQIAHLAAKDGHGVGFVSLEMSKESLVQRLICSTARVDYQRMRGGFLNADERRRVAVAVSDLDDIPLWIDDTGARTMPAITAAIRKLKSQHPDLKLVVIDHLQEMKGMGRQESKHVEIGDLTHSVKNLCKRMKLVVVLCCQLNRTCETENRSPQLSDLRESGTIEEAADVVLFIHRWERYQKFRDREDLRGMADLILAKQRNGGIGLMKLVFLGGQQRFDLLAGEESMRENE